MHRIASSPSLHWRRRLAVIAATCASLLAHAVKAGAQEHDMSKMDQDSDAGEMTMGGVLGIPMERAGSGTSWLPDAAPMNAWHSSSGPWTLMAHGVAFGMYDKQNGTRGNAQVSSVNWGMLMLSHQTGASRVQLRTMLSAEPLTVRDGGYPLLLQTGETYNGQPLRDRQHPHDLFMEIAAVFEHALTSKVGYSLYAAPVGEPASGPVAFPHRPSAMHDALAPLGHHWQDATHISFGVLTAGLFTHSVRLEGSIFNGREPDEIRTNFDYKGRSLDSYAGRLTWNPTTHWSLSGSYAYLDSPETLEPDESVQRLSASVLGAHSLGAKAELWSAFVFGANKHEGSDEFEPSYLAEASLQLGGAHNLFGRAEWVRKGSSDLVLGAGSPDEEFGITSFAGGYMYEVAQSSKVRLGIGGRASVNFVPSELEPYYGSRTPTGFAVYVRLAPQRMSSGHNMH
jgi:hypothetical protein